MVAALVEAGADVNAKDGSGRSMLRTQSRLKRCEVVAVLAEDADVNAADVRRDSIRKCRHGCCVISGGGGGRERSGRLRAFHAPKRNLV